MMITNDDTWATVPRVIIIMFVMLIVACGDRGGAIAKKDTTHHNNEPTTVQLKDTLKNLIEDVIFEKKKDSTTIQFSGMKISPKPEIWTRFNIDQLHLSLDVFSDLSAITMRVDGSLTTMMQEMGPVRLILWAGPDQTIEGWRKRLNVNNEARFEAEQDITFCDKAARRQVAFVTQAEAVGYFVESDGTIQVRQEASTRIHICVSFSHIGQNILQCWIIDEDNRPTRAADESRFFASTRCH